MRAALLVISLAVEIFDSHPSHDYINIDDYDPYPNGRDSIFFSEHHLDKLRRAATFNWNVSRDQNHDLHFFESKSDDGGWLTVAVGSEELSVKRCKLAHSAYLPPCSENKKILLNNGKQQYVYWVIDEHSREFPKSISFSSAYSASLAELSWLSLLWSMDHFNSSIRKIDWSRRTRNYVENLWKEKMDLWFELASLSVYVVQQLQSERLRHCLFSWHSLMLTKPLQDQEWEDMSNNSAYLRHTILSTNQTCPPELFSSTRHQGSWVTTFWNNPIPARNFVLSGLTSIRQHFDPDDGVAAIKQARVHLQSLLAVIRSVLQDFRKSDVARKVFAMYVYTEKTLQEIDHARKFSMPLMDMGSGYWSDPNETDTSIAMQLHRKVEDIISEWHSTIFGLYSVSSTDDPLWEDLKSLTKEPWDPAFTGRVPQYVLHLSDEQKDFVRNKLVKYGFKKFREPANGYHNVIGFGESFGNHEILDLCSNSTFRPHVLKPPAPPIKIVLKVPMATAMTHYNDWINQWLDERMNMERCSERHEVVRSLVSHPLRVRQQDLFVTIEEFVDGFNMRQMILNEIPSEQVPALVYKVTRDLVPLWTEGYNHRDLSLGNIMITADGRTKLIDAGALRKIGDNEFPDARYFEHLRSLLEHSHPRIVAHLPTIDVNSTQKEALLRINASLLMLSQDIRLSPM